MPLQAPLLQPTTGEEAEYRPLDVYGTAAVLAVVAQQVESLQPRVAPAGGGGVRLAQHDAVHALVLRGVCGVNTI